jgi:periplasmic protein TonB
MVFKLAALPAAVVHDIVLPAAEAVRAVAPPSEPRPHQAAEPPQVAKPPPEPAPMAAAVPDPIRLPPPAPMEVTQRVPTAARPPRTVVRKAAPRTDSAPAGTFANLTPARSAAEVQSAEAAAGRAAAADPLIPPRPVAGMETNRAPAYPEIALRRHEVGRVMLRVSVSAHGQPLEVDVAETSGFPILDSAALSAVRQWRFVPAMQAGTPVAAIAEVPVRFQIDN